MEKTIYWILAVLLGVALVVILTIRQDANKKNDRALGVSEVRTKSTSAEKVSLEHGGNNMSVQQILPLVDRAHAKGDSKNKSEAILALIGDDTDERWCNYGSAMRMLDQSYVPLLREMLKDPHHKNQWRQIAPMIAWLSDKKDTESLEAILDYLRRSDVEEWTRASERSAQSFGKAMVLRYIGLFELQEGDNFLKKTFTQQGAKEIVAGWFGASHLENDRDAQSLIVDVRGYAARGLVSSQKKEDISLVEMEYEVFAHASQEIEGPSGRDFQVGDDHVHWHDYLVEAMAERDVIADKGLKYLLGVIGTERILMVLDPYLDKYGGKVSGGGVVIIDPCPICGKTGRSK